MPAPAEERRCPRCDAPHAEDQEYCLQCGAPLPATTGVLATLGSAWRRRLGWYPGDWVWPALLALLVAVGAGVVSALLLAESSNSASDTLVRTAAERATAPETERPPEPTLSTPTTTTGPTTATRSAKPKPPPTLVAWPMSKSGWTIVLDSIPAANGRAGAVAEAKQALRLGLNGVGVIDSARFSSLHPGYFVVFAGIYDTQAEAQSHIIEAHRHGFRGPYPRQITP